MPEPVGKGAKEGAARQRVVLVTGPSGAGRSTAIHTLEDIGYEAIDNIPLTLIPRLVSLDTHLERPLALGIDVRNRDFSVDGLLELKASLSVRSEFSTDLLYLDCLPDVLVRRYSETRRRHPMAPEESPEDGIRREMALLGQVRDSADFLIDTTDMTVHELRADVEQRFASGGAGSMALSLHSFSYKRGLPQGLDMVLDCRFLRNPHWEPSLRASTGLEAAVSDYVRKDERHDEFVKNVLNLSLLVLPGCVEEGKSHFSIGFGCTGGKHRSVSVAETVAQALAKQGWRVSIRHRELERRGQI